MLKAALDKLVQPAQSIATEQLGKNECYAEEPINEDISDAIVSSLPAAEISDEDITDIVDIDEQDFENTQLAAEYVKDIYNYLIYMEVSGSARCGGHPLAYIGD